MPFLFGAVFSVLYIVGMSLFVAARANEFSTLELNELGDFLAGVCSPLALVWLFVGFTIQAKALRESRQQLLDAAELQEESLELLRQQTDAAQDRLDLEASRRESELEPRFFLNFLASNVLAGSEATYEFELCNEGPAASDVHIDVHPPLRTVGCHGALINARIRNGERHRLGYSVTPDTPTQTVVLRVKYTREDGKRGVYAKQLSVVASTSPSDASLPTLTLLS